ncbi:MAG TPA: cupredoxin domain-containing protein [Candidatus Norongarragalinales archaeon]|jgi:cytochrome c oxidase subunit 2|nr:cupredoxin domain-containing protein [Candidatus Norongarragalinales archaeon]
MNQQSIGIIIAVAALLLSGCMQANAPSSDASKITGLAVQATAVPTIVPTTAAPSTTPSPSAVSTSIPEIQEFSLVASDWKWIPDTITVKKGIPVRITITTTDVAHGFGLTDFGINKRINTGETTIVEFTPDKTGSFSFRCTVICGSGHGAMKGTLVVTD